MWILGNLLGLGKDQKFVHIGEPLIGSDEKYGKCA